MARLCENMKQNVDQSIIDEHGLIRRNKIVQSDDQTSARRHYNSSQLVPASSVGIGSDPTLTAARDFRIVSYIEVGGILIRWVT